MKTMIAAVDFSNSTDGVLAMATGLAKAHGASLHLLHVLEPEPTYTAYGFTPDEFPAIHAFQQEARKRAEAKLAELVAKARIDVPGTESHLGEGSPLQGILELVKTVGADLVVLGAHGHGLVVSLLLGSVAEFVARHAKCSVQIIRTPAGN